MAGWLRHRGYAARSACCRLPLHFFLRVCKAHEPVGIEAFLPEASVERFDEGIVCGFAGPGEVQRDAASIGPEGKISRHELGV